ncbi:MAG: helix-turn-helix domain-containing protein [Verrucomicrobiota bacterium]
MSSSRHNAKIDSVLSQCERFLPTGAVYVPAAEREPVRRSGKLPPFCRECVTSCCPSLCRSAILANARQGYLIGEPCYAPCWAGLNTVVFPVAPGGRLVGALEISGFCYPEIRADTLRLVRENTATLPEPTRRRLARHTDDFVEIPTMEVRGYSDFLLDSLFSAGLNSVDEFRRRREKYLQQRRIADLMRRQGNAPPDAETVLEGIAAFAAALSRRDRERAMSLLDNLLSRILLVAGDSPAKVRAHVLPFVSLLFRARLLDPKTPAAEAGGAAHICALRELEEAGATEDICYWIFHRVRTFLDEQSSPTMSRAPTLGQRILAYLEKHLSHSVTVLDAAKELRIGSSTIQRAVKAETGRSFHQQLLHTRIGRARERLLTTNRTASQVAHDCGFHDAAHFSRLFKRETGNSPSAYRRAQQTAEAPKG